MDPRNPRASVVLIRNGRIAYVGNALPAQGLGARQIDLQGRAVIPGIIDNHNHIALMANRPGYHTPLENCASIREVQETLATRAASVPPGAFLTTIGGFHFNQFAERRLPTRRELDEAVPRHPTYLSIGFSGPSVVNSLGRRFFAERGIPVGEDGSIAPGEASNRALLTLRRELLTAEERRRGALDALRYGLSLGVTTHLDQGAFQATNTPQDGAAHEDNYTMHRPFFQLHAEGRLPARIRINFLHTDLSPEVPTLRERLRNSFPFFGDEWIRTVGIGEFTAGDPFELFAHAEPGAAWRVGTRLVAAAGWRNENHSLTRTDYQAIIRGWEEVDREIPLGGLRWTLAHVPFITREWVERLKALGGGLSLTGWRYLAGTREANGPPFRMIVESGIPAGLSSDGMQIAPMNPWLHMYYATTGVNARGEPINEEQRISRQEALRLYTRANGWFLREEEHLGSLEVGKWADLVVLNRDPFQVPDEGLKRIRSVLTIVGGRIVHDEGLLRAPAPER
ncbi:MAG: amidohydrolase family protein [Armatimonadetes bacterium]|nr:amidohydrolase family protein [Armatimonadota bacterium]MDW8152618.1 amidohydrolase family protein [Armatimonadota bacterium]